MSLELDTTASIFDRNELRTLRASYVRALGQLEVDRLMDAAARDELAKLVFHLGRDRVLEGTGLRYKDAAEGIANEASAFLQDTRKVAICA